MSRMKMANALFAASALLFAAAFWWRFSHEGTAASCFYFLAQSVFIGCAADWFATAALFRRPLGIPCHTALIPRNRARIIAAIRRAAETRLLRPGTWDDFFAKWSASESLRTFLETESGRRALAKISETVAKEILATVVSERTVLAEKIARRIRSAAETAAPRLCERFLSAETADKILVKLLRAGANYAKSEEARRLVARFLQKWTEAQKENPLVAMAISMGETMGVIDYDDMAEALCRSLQDKIEEISETGTPVFSELSSHFREALRNLSETDAGRAVWNRFVTETAENVSLEERTEEILSAFCEKETVQAAVSLLVSEAMAEGAQTFLQDKEQTARFDDAARSLLISVARHEQTFAGDAMEAALSSYDEARLNRFIYSRTKEELGSIRINGAMVAALAGVFLYAVFAAMHM